MKKLLLGLTVAAMLAAMVGCGSNNGGGDNQIPVDSAISADLAADFKFNAESTYYGYSEKDQASLGVVKGRFTYIDSKADRVITGTVTEDGSLDAEGTEITYKTTEGKIEVTVGDRSVVLSPVEEDHYVTASQLLNLNISGEDTSEDLPGLPELPEEDTETTSEDTVSESEAEQETEPGDTSEDGSEPAEASEEPSSEAEPVNAGFRAGDYDFIVEHSDTGVSITLAYDGEDGDTNLMSSAYTANADVIDSDDDLYQYKAVLTGTDAGDTITVYWNEPVDNGPGSLHIVIDADTVMDFDLT